MSILNTSQERTITREDKLKIVSNRIKSLTTGTYSELVKVQSRGIDLGFNNREFTAQEIIESLGADAVKVLQFHALLTEFLVTVSTIDGLSYTPATSPVPFTIEDGAIVFGG